MKKDWHLLPKILSGEKVIESRWYMNRSTPWNKVKAGDRVYFKNSGEPVTVRAEVDKVLQFEDLDSEKVKSLLDEYGGLDGIGPEDMGRYYGLFQNKRYCILVFLKDPIQIIPFRINKNGFGLQSAWLIIDDIDKIKI